MVCRGSVVWCMVLVVFHQLQFSLVTTADQKENDAGSLEGNVTGVCEILCSGKLLEYVQMARIFNDSKYFVDMHLKKTPHKISNDFNDFLKRFDKPSKEDLTKFIANNFDPPGKEFERWVPKDWKSLPKYTYEVYDKNLRHWIRGINAKWKSLGRKISEDVKNHSDLYTQIYVPNPFIIPGGRFIELYYWDSYWIIEGLLLSEMYSTAKGMIENFIYLVNQFGYVPNGSRKYYLGRSQPPFFIPMVDLYLQYKKDLQFLNQSIGALETEYNFWLQNRSVFVSVEGVQYRIFHYNVVTTNPRPESFFKDMELVKGSKTKEERQRIFSEIKSAAESGWDFSSRWFLHEGEHSLNMSDISTSTIAPVCLNSMMVLNAKILSNFFEMLGNVEKQKMYQSLADEANVTMSRIFWSERDGIWLDFNIKTKVLIPGFYPSNLMPLWTESFGKEREPKFIIEQVVAYLDRYEVDEFPGGIPASLIYSGQQWDLPNGWAPLQYFVVMGLRKAARHSQRARDIAFNVAHKWVINAFETYQKTSPHSMLEKYNITSVGVSGQGGEYNTQEGFGWTNAVVMKFLSIYGHRIKTKNVYDPAPLAVGLCLLFVSVVAVISYMHRIRSCYRVKCESREMLE